MCRYAMIVYKPHYACFDCRKTFKRRLWYDIRKGNKVETIAVCPQCNSPMADMGKDFESPKMNDVKAWQHLKKLYNVGITFHSCGCQGPGYIPADHEALLDLFESIKLNYFKEIDFWRHRIEPENKQEKIKDQQRYWHKLSSINPNYKKENVKNQEGIDYWLKKIKEIEAKIASLKTSQF